MKKDSVFSEKESELIINIDTIIPPIWIPNKAYGNDSEVYSFPTVFRNATVWTNEEEGICKYFELVKKVCKQDLFYKLKILRPKFLKNLSKSEEQKFLSGKTLFFVLEVFNHFL